MSNCTLSKYDLIPSETFGARERCKQQHCVNTGGCCIGGGQLS